MRLILVFRGSIMMFAIWIKYLSNLNQVPLNFLTSRNYYRKLCSKTGTSLNQASLSMSPHLLGSRTHALIILNLSNRAIIHLLK